MIASPEVSGDGGGVRLVRRRGQMDVTIKVKRVGVRKKEEEERDGWERTPARGEDKEMKGRVERG